MLEEDRTHPPQPQPPKGKANPLGQTPAPQNSTANPKPSDTKALTEPQKQIEKALFQNSGIPYERLLL